jgi:hypothetical protein
VLSQKLTSSVEEGYMMEGVAGATRVVSRQLVLRG